LKIAVGSDEKTVLTDYVVEELNRRGHHCHPLWPVRRRSNRLA
jgi:hypothetical protein